MNRRTPLSGSAAALANAMIACTARADVPVPYSFDSSPPTSGRDAFIKWMGKIGPPGQYVKIMKQRNADRAKPATPTTQPAETSATSSWPWLRPH